MPREQTRPWLSPRLLPRSLGFAAEVVAEEEAPSAIDRIRARSMSDHAYITWLLAQIPKSCRYISKSKLHLQLMFSRAQIKTMLQLKGPASGVTVFGVVLPSFEVASSRTIV